MLPLRLVFGLLLLTSLQLWAEPISLPFTEPGSSASLVGIKAVENTPGALTLDFVSAPEFLRGGASVRTLSTNSFPEALFDLTNPQSSRVVLSANARVTALAEEQGSFAIPEPAALLLLGSGLAVLAALTKQRKRKKV